MADDERRDAGERPAFPAWLRRIDPTLEAEDRNALFQAFRQRRARRPLSLDAVIDGMSVWLPDAGVLIAIAGLLIIIIEPVTACCLVPITAAMLAVLRRGLQARKVADSRLPMKLGRVFSTRGFKELAALDLWLTGAHGNEVLEAIYLERREQTWRSTILLCAMAAGLMLLAYHVRMRPSSLELAFASVAAGLLFWQLFQVSVIGGINRAIAREVEPRAEMWGADKGVADAVRLGMGKGVIAMTMVLIVVIIPAMCLTMGKNMLPILFQLMPTAGKKDQGLVEAFPRFLTDPDWIVIILALVIATILPRVRRIWRTRATAKLDEVLRSGNAAFESFMAGKVAGDVEGGAWGQWAENMKNSPVLREDFLAKNAARPVENRLKFSRTPQRPAASDEGPEKTPRSSPLDSSEQ